MRTIERWSLGLFVASPAAAVTGIGFLHAGFEPGMAYGDWTLWITGVLLSWAAPALMLVGVAVGIAAGWKRRRFRWWLPVGFVLLGANVLGWMWLLNGTAQ